MFTGIVTSLGQIESAEQRGDLRIVVGSDYPAEAIKPGESIAVNGACLTVVAISKQASGKGRFTADLSAETLNRTAPGQWQTGKMVNLERALRLGDTLDGHMVTGHIDGVASIVNIAAVGDSHMLCVEAPQTLAHFIAEKGSVCLDGVSLTVNKVEGARFWVNIIPHTWQKTTFKERQPGDQVNIEIDLIARYVARLLQK